MTTRMGINDKPRFDAYSALGLAARLLLGGIFVYSGFLKTAAPVENFAASIEAYRIIPPSLATWTARLISWSELYLGGFLIAGSFTRLSALSLAAMLAAFELSLLSALIRKLPLKDCGCFGAGAGHSITYALIQDAVLLLAAAAAFKYGQRIYSVDSLAERNGHKKNHIPQGTN